MLASCAEVAQEAVAFIGPDSNALLRSTACQVANWAVLQLWVGMSACVTCGRLPRRAASAACARLVLASPQWPADMLCALQLLLELARLDCDAVWLELMLVASQASPPACVANPDPGRLPPLAALLPVQPMQAAGSAAGGRAKQAARLLQRVQHMPVQWHQPFRTPAASVG